MFAYVYITVENKYQTNKKWGYHFFEENRWVLKLNSMIRRDSGFSNFVRMCLNHVNN